MNRVLKGGIGCLAYSLDPEVIFDRRTDRQEYPFAQCVLAGRLHLCMTLCMAFKTISLSEDAYRKLKKAKRSPSESFTEVVRRASWDEPAETMGEALDLLEAEFGGGKTAITAEELETSRQMHARRKARR